MSDSRIPGLFRKTCAERIGTLVEHGFLSVNDADGLRDITGMLSPSVADKMVENVIGVFGLPFAVAPNFMINGRGYVVPMVIEEPSVVAGVAGAARLMRKARGISVASEESLLFGQVHLVGISDHEDSLQRLQAATAEIIAEANALQPKLISRGGGVRAVSFIRRVLRDGRAAIVAHLAVDTRDAMGANLVNTICEGIAPKMEVLSGGVAHLKILSNLSDQSLVTASITIPTSLLRLAEYSGEAVRDGIVLANELAIVDPFRATTHNKGIMNGVDSVAIATGNDWRAIEASVHAYASRAGQYAPLTDWHTKPNGDLYGTLTLPLKVGIVGGSLESNPAARTGLRILAVESAGELAQVMCAVGLAQNFAALRALATSGIQKGHMSLHARSVASSADVAPELFDEVVRRLIASGEIKQWKAIELADELAQELSVKRCYKPSDATAATGRAAGKMILFGEHAVVYGKHAVAFPILDAVTATCEASDQGVELAIPEWGVCVKFELHDDSLEGVAKILQLLLTRIVSGNAQLRLTVNSKLPPAMGLGSSAALATALARAIDTYYSLGLTAPQIDRHVFACEKISHGNPSGIDNTVAVFGQAISYSLQADPQSTPIELQQMPPLLIACSSRGGETIKQVRNVRALFESTPEQVAAIFEQIDLLSRAAVDLLLAGDLETLGAYMNLNHGLLNAIGVSTPELERMVCLARHHGAIGAKITGAGGGGSIVALCPDNLDSVEAAMNAAGYRTIRMI